MIIKKSGRILALLICLTLIISCLPIVASAEGTDTVISMTEGDVTTDFVSPGTECTSTDSSIAWVDSDGCLNALKPGTVTISVPNESGQTDYTVTVSDFEDGSDIVGNLKLVARFNDSMQFYDGHTYLIFTSYQDGVEVKVDDLYASYLISDEYYKDIRTDISNGSNHTGNGTDKYFTFTDEQNSVTLNRGEVVTIGMYRDFDLTVQQAALGSLQNSSKWNSIQNDTKTALVNAVFNIINTREISADGLLEDLKKIFTAEDLNFNELINGVVDGGVCFNRELYNQKLEWDQYENVTYDLDITKNQLDALQENLKGNNGKFSIISNSCATVALKAWNAAVGTRDGVDTAYKLNAKASGIYDYVDAPKGVRDSIVNRLPGYYLNNSEGVAEPGAGYQDETGWVYVSAPKYVTPLTFVYNNDNLTIDENRTKISSVINAAEESLSYNKDEQTVNVDIHTESSENLTTISGIEFTANGKTVSVNNETVLDEGIWFKAVIIDPIENEDYYVTDENGTALPSYYENGTVSFYCDDLSASYQIINSSECTKNIIRTYINDNGINADTVIYQKSGELNIPITDFSELNSGTKIYIKSVLDSSEFNGVLSDIVFNNESVFTEEYYDADEKAYCVTMPKEYSVIRVTYENAVVTVKDKNILQISVGDTLSATDYADLMIGDDLSDRLSWTIIDDGEGVISIEDGYVKAIKEGSATVWAGADDNENIGILFIIEVYEDTKDMVSVTFDENADFIITCNEGNDIVPFSGYLVAKSSELKVVPLQTSSKAVLYVLKNNERVKITDIINAEEDTEIKVGFANAEIQNIPKTIELTSKGSTYQLEGKVKYTGLYSLLPVYDSSIKYVSSDPLISVSEEGLISVDGDIPDEGKAVLVTAYAGSSNDQVSSSCKVILGDYQGSEIVGKLTISARQINENELVAHGVVTFTSYNDIDIPISYYSYYEPDERYYKLLSDYEENPDSFTSDPALYNENELGLENRSSYFTHEQSTAGSDPKTISLKAGESITVSNYGYDPSNMIAIMKTLDSEALSTSENAQNLLKQLALITQGQEVDAPLLFDSLVGTLIEITETYKATGVNPANGHSEGGMDINKEMYNQFRRNDSQMPNNYYTIEITADELLEMKKYLANPDNNYYSLFAKNCATGSADLWNATLSDKPELHLKGNYTGVATDPQSLNIEIGLLSLNTNLEGEGGKDFYPKTVAYTPAVLDTIEKIKAIGTVTASDECRDKIEAAEQAYEGLSYVQKERVYNYKDLTTAREIYDILKEIVNRQDFQKYKEEACIKADELIQEGDGEAISHYVQLAKLLISYIPYDDVKTLEENEAVIDMILDELAKAIEEQRKEDSKLPGDVNGDGKIDITDITIGQMYLSSYISESEINLENADINEDGVFDIKDVALIQQMIAKM